MHGAFTMTWHSFRVLARHPNLRSINNRNKLTLDGLSSSKHCKTEYLRISLSSVYSSVKKTIEENFVGLDKPYAVFKYWVSPSNERRTLGEEFTTLDELNKKYSLQFAGNDLIDPGGQIQDAYPQLTDSSSVKSSIPARTCHQWCKNPVPFSLRESKPSIHHTTDIWRSQQDFPPKRDKKEV